MKKGLLKKALALGCTGAMSFGMLAGTVNAEEIDTSKEVELTMYVISDRPAMQDEVDAHFNELLKEKLNCTLKVNWIGWAEYANKYPLLFSSGEQFDMAYSATWLNFPTLARKGAFMNLDEMWEQYAPENFAMTSEEAKMQATVDGHYYCVPTLLSTYGVYGVAYRGDLIPEGQEYDMSTFEGIESYCDMIKETHPEIEPIDQYSSAPEWSFAYMSNQGYNALDNGARWLWYDTSAENPIVLTNNDYEGMPEFLEMMARWNEKGFFSKSALADTDSTKTKNGKAAVKLHNIDTYSDLAASRPEWNFQYEYLTKDPSHLPYTQDCMVISNTAKNPERALAFWNLLTTDQELFDAFMYGILDTSYTLNEKGQFKITDPDLYAMSAMWAARTNELNRDNDGVPARYNELKQEFEEHIQSGVGAEKYAGFVFDTSNVETEYAACGNVWQQYWWPLELGYTDAVSGLEEYGRMMEAAGIDKVVEEAQRQLDEYIAGLN